MGEEIGYDPFHRSFSIEPIERYYVKCEATGCDFQIDGFCTCTTGHCYAEENNDFSVHNLDSRFIIEVNDLKTQL